MNFGVNTRAALDQGHVLPDPDLFWKLPSRPGDQQMRAVHPDVPVPPKGRSRRILVMGDSCSRISIKAPPYPVLLERILVGGEVQVWNAAVPGYTTHQGLAWLKIQLLTLDADVAVVYYGWNDHWRATGTTDRDYAERLSGQWLRLGLLVGGNPDPPPLRVSGEHYRDNLRAIVTALEEAGTAVILVAAPSHLTSEAKGRLVQARYLVRQDDAEALHREYSGYLRQAATGTGAMVLDAASIFRHLDQPRRLILRDGIHLTDDGHTVMAQMIAAILTWESEGVPDTPSLTARATEVLADLDDAR